MATVGWIITFFGLLVTLGGYTGYAKAGSLASLVMGIGFGIALIISGILILCRKVYAQKIALGLCITLGLFFGLRFLNTYKIMPAGIMLALSLLAIMSLTIQNEDNR